MNMQRAVQCRLGPQIVAAFILLLAACGNAAVTSNHPSVQGPGGGVIKPGGPVYFDSSFYLRGLGNRCWDFGGQAYWAVGGPVFLYSCNSSVAQQIRVKELDATHDVELRVQSTYCIGVRGGRVGIGQALELQTPCNGSPAQRFAFDGDSILMGTQVSGAVTRDFVIEPAGDATPNRTPLVVGSRDVSDAEYFRMWAVDGTTRYPTTGFKRVNNETSLDNALALGWGTVIEIDDQQPLILTHTKKQIQAGVTLRGYRKLAYQGPEIVYPNINPDEQWIFEITQSHVRVTGLHLRGPTDSTDGSLPIYHAIRVTDGNDVLIDHIMGSSWTGSVVNVVGNDHESQPYAQDCMVPPPPPYPRPASVRILDNFLTHNEREDRGYGVAVGAGGFALISGNVAYNNRHSITADGLQTTGYVAQDNFILSDAPGYGFLGHNHEQDTDKHGTLDPGHWYGGVSDDYADLGWNTFLGTNRHNFEERGTPCRFTAVHDSIFVQDRNGAITSITTNPGKLAIYANQYGVPDPTGDLAVGDFDGDHIDDVFVGTGAGWWFSSGGKAEWRFLNRMPEHASQLRFGDFDGDGRTDVLALHGGVLEVSWAGISPWQPINTVSSGITLSDLAIGNFDGDHNADIFLANGTQWFYAPAGKNWVYFADSTYRTKDLRFGDFNADGKTDVFGIVANKWQFVPGGGNSWQPLRTALTNTVDGLVVADFDGDGYADIARQSPIAFFNLWQYSARGRADFTPLRLGQSDQSIARAPVGRFNGDSKADVLLWSGLDFSIASAARDPIVTLSQQEMR